MAPRLDTWKSIAQHMGKSARTLQRWHREYGLPVHHLAGESGSVYAYGDELDTWLRGRSRSELREAGPISGPELTPAVLDYETSLPSRRSSDSDLISARAKGRSLQMVSLAARMWDSLSPRNLNSIVLHYRKAADLDPESAEAYAGLSMGLIAQGIWRLVHPTGAFAAARVALHHALAIDPELLLAKTADAWLKMLVPRDWQGAREEFDGILKQAPTCTRSLNGRALLHIAEGSLEKATRMLMKSADLSPLSSDAMAFYLWAAYLDGRFKHVLDQVSDLRASGRHDPVSDVVEALTLIQHFGPSAALERLEELAAESPQTEGLRGALGYACAVSGEGQKARELLGSLMSLTGSAWDNMSRAPYAVALVWIGLNEKHKALKCLKQCYRNGSLWSLGYRFDPILEPLRSDPQCLPMLDELDYPGPPIGSARG